VDGLEGPRKTPREPALLAAALLTLERSHAVEIVEVSAAGARIRGCGPIALEQDLWLKVGTIDVLATVAWIADDLCGVSFDRALDAEEQAHVRHEARHALVTRLSPEERLAALDWKACTAR
jgi:hypothetical protein